MRVVCSSRGSRGDVYPIVEIAAVMAGRGHDVTLCIPPRFEDIARERGLRTSYYTEDSVSIMKEMGTGLSSGVLALRWFVRNIDEQFDMMLDKTSEADVLVTSVNEAAGSSVAEHRRMPHYRVAYCPVLPGDQPPPVLAWQHLPTFANKAAWRLLNTGMRLVCRKVLDRRRAELGLEPIGEFGSYCAGTSHTILAMNSSLAPPASEWCYPYSYTGYPFGPDHRPLDEGLEAFLAAGPQPVYIGFGSVDLQDPRGLTRMILRAVERSGCRAVLGAGWSGLGTESDSLPPFVYRIGDVPHASLFPRLAGAAHHGGSGTVHTAARAGIPQLIIPRIADQFYWASRIQTLGLGPPALRPGNLRERALSNALRALSTNESYAHRAQLFSEALRHEDGVGAAVRVIEGNS